MRANHTDADVKRRPIDLEKRTTMRTTQYDLGSVKLFVTSVAVRTSGHFNIRSRHLFFGSPSQRLPDLH